MSGIACCVCGGVGGSGEEREGWKQAYLSLTHNLGPVRHDFGLVSFSVAPLAHFLLAQV